MLLPGYHRLNVVGVWPEFCGWDARVDMETPAGAPGATIGTGTQFRVVDTGNSTMVSAYPQRRRCVPSKHPDRYVGQGQVDKAKAILVKYHGDGDPGSAIVALEMKEMLEVISAQGSDKRWWDFRGLFNSRSARYRTFLVSCIALFGTLDLPPTSYYLPLMGESRRPLLDIRF